MMIAKKLLELKIHIFRKNVYYMFFHTFLVCVKVRCVTEITPINHSVIPNKKLR